MHPRIKNWIADEKPSAAKLEGLDCFSNPNIEICDLEPSKTEMAMSYMNGVLYKKPVQSKFSPDSRRDKSRIERSVDRAGTSGKSGPSVLLLTDSSVRHARVPDNDDDDFVDPPPIWQETSPLGKSSSQDYPSAAHHSPIEQQAREEIKELRSQISDLKSYNEVLNVELDDIKSQMSLVNAEQTTKMNYIVQMQSNIKSDLMEIRTNMQFLLETVSTMISNSMDEIMKRFDHQKSDHSVGDKDHPVVGGSDKTEEDTTTTEPTSELLVKRVSRPVKILQSPFVAGEGKLFKHDDTVVFENYKGRVDEVDSSAFTASFQRGYKPRTKKKFSDEDGRINLAFVIGLRPIGKSYRDWKVVKGIEPFVKILAASMNNLGISKKDPDYIEPNCMELKVTVDDTLPQQTNENVCDQEYNVYNF
ncbi:Hypothetical predicted protein [Olea europaea subsp. europaea]|uniref:Uncharacterized protein n=1 Tax=Olea europaea subsp. europaea TaxID=158383 RepID=A0A8S0PCJ2_OLEEU|nr:Hypothetical predicted protein [Olea europaea subsp. europaea]